MSIKKGVCYECMAVKRAEKGVVVRGTPPPCPKAIEPTFAN